MGYLIDGKDIMFGKNINSCADLKKEASLRNPEKKLFQD